MLTFFTSCKPFRGEDEIAQRNAITSWKMLRPEPEIFILGNDFGAREFAKELGIGHVPDIERSPFGNPLVSDIFAKGEAAASNDICCYINADIILLSDFMRGVETVASRKQEFLLIGKRHDLDVKERVIFNPGWEDGIRKRAVTEGKLYHLPGMDYFVFRKGQWEKILPFVLGNLRWDNWMIYEARRKKITTVDGTRAITVIHQNHAMKHAEESEHGDIDFDPAAVYNVGLYGKGVTAFFHLDASHVLTQRGMKPALSLPYLRRRLITTPLFHPKATRVCKFLSRLVN